jgi:hypothetical protein
MKHWKMVEYAISEDNFAESWEKMRTAYAHKQEAINYLANTWLINKEKFVSSWADGHLHFGSKNTSRVLLAPLKETLLWRIIRFIRLHYFNTKM